MSNIPFNDLKIPILPSNVPYFPNVSLELDQELDESDRYEAYRDLMKKGNYVIILCEAEEGHTKDVFSYSLDGKEAKLYNIGTLTQIISVERREGAIKIVVRGFNKCRVIRYFKPSKTMPVALASEGEIFDTPLGDTDKSEKLVRNFISWVCYGQVNNEFASDKKFPSLELEVADKLLRLENARALDESDVATNRKHFLLTLKELLYYLATFYITPRVVAGVTKAILRADTVEKELEMINFQFKKLFKVNAADKSGDGENNSYQARYAEIKDKMHGEVQAEVERTIKYLENPGNESERQIRGAWLDNTLNLPWGVLTPEEEDFEKAEKTLAETHYGLQKAKDVILDIVATQKAKKKKDCKAPVKTVLCFFGPPGVGKTSLGQSIAKAMGRQFIRESLGGVRDEADIRGHRRTYIGAFPGKIMEGLRKAKTSNPVFMIDEIDKLALDFRGDPGSALMEVFDPEQNHSFKDHYYAFPFDLSQILFICTANNLDKIQGPLRDRMEIIRLSGYFEHEKIAIAKSHLIARQLKEQGLEGRVNFDVTEEALRDIITDHTFEAGVRGVEIHIRSIIRKINRKLEKGENLGGEITITPKELESYLGRPRVKQKKAYVTEPGETFGLAVMTNADGVSLGEILPLQCKLPLETDERAKSISYTGNFQEVMKQSIKNALTCVRMLLEAEYPRLSDPFRGRIIDIGSANAAQLKDGPSAGMAMAILLLSTVFKKPVKSYLAMTGELDKQGRITAVGGIKDKILGAERAEIKEVILPLDNKDDFDELPDSIKHKITAHFVNTLREAIPIAFDEGLPKEAIKAA